MACRPSLARSRPTDAPLVRNLKAAGAIVVGRTNTPELSMRATTVQPADGPTRNPWHPDASPGARRAGRARRRRPGSARSTTATTSGAPCGPRVTAGHDLKPSRVGFPRGTRPPRSSGACSLAHVRAGRAAADRRRRPPGRARHGRPGRARPLVDAGALRRAPRPPAAPVAVTRSPHGYPMDPEIGPPWTPGRGPLPRRATRWKRSSRRPSPRRPGAGCDGPR